jgi:hypothetical protein
MQKKIMIKMTETLPIILFVCHISSLIPISIQVSLRQPLW